MQVGKRGTPGAWLVTACGLCTAAGTAVATVGPTVDKAGITVVTAGLAALAAGFAVAEAFVA